jgi:hypothetical protein
VNENNSAKSRKHVWEGGDPDILGYATAFDLSNLPIVKEFWGTPPHKAYISRRIGASQTGQEPTHAWSKRKRKTAKAK